MKGNALFIVLGIILMAVSFNVFPTIVTGADAILDTANSTDYTGLAAVVGIGPTLLFLGVLFGGMASFGLGMKGMWSSHSASRKRKTSTPRY